MRQINKKLAIIILSLILAGCTSLNSRFGVDSAYYADAKELPSLKMPAGSLALSKRYEIPEVPASNKSAIIANIVPPDYEKG